MDDKINLQSRDVFKFSLKILYFLIEDDLLFERGTLCEYYPDKETLEKYKANFDSIPKLERKKIEFNDVVIESRFLDIYEKIYLKINADFGHYFRNLYRIIKLIDEKKFHEDKIEDFKIKYSYTSIIRSQLSDSELGWIFFNGLFNNKLKFKPLIEKYTLLKTINQGDEILTFYSALYHNTAFEKPNDHQLLEHVSKVL